jgi:hypothetical protein
LGQKVIKIPATCPPIPRKKFSTESPVTIALFLRPAAPLAVLVVLLSSLNTHFVDETLADRFRASGASSRSAFPDLIELADSFPNT